MPAVLCFLFPLALKVNPLGTPSRSLGPRTGNPRKPSPRSPHYPTPSSDFALRTSTNPHFRIQLWVTERLPVASSMEHGRDLPSVQLLMKKNQVRQRLKAEERVPRASPDLKVCFLKNWGSSGSPWLLGVILDFSGSPFLTSGGWVPLVGDRVD